MHQDQRRMPMVDALTCDDPAIRTACAAALRAGLLEALAKATERYFDEAMTLEFVWHAPSVH